MCYPDQLQSAKLAALTALAELLATTTDPIEKRRIATTILRIPDPKPDRATQDRATGCPGFDGQPVQSTPRADPHPILPTQDTPSHSLHPTFISDRLDAEYQQTLNDLLDTLSFHKSPSPPLRDLCVSAVNPSSGNDP